MTMLSMRAVLLIVGVYGYFLIFAQFAFVELMRSAGVSGTKEKVTLGIMALSGIAAGFLAAKRGPSVRSLRIALIAAAMVAASSPFARSVPEIFWIPALVTGGALGMITVNLAAMLRRWCGLMSVGLGVGLGYAICNLPPVFMSSAVHQSFFAAGFAMIACLAVPRDGESAADEWSVPSHGTLPLIAALLGLTALVWLDSAAFFIIQHTHDLKESTWGEAMLWRNAAVHLGGGLLAGWWMKKTSGRGLMLGAWALLALAAFLVNSPDGRSAAGWLYPFGVSLYSTMLVAVPGWFSGVKDARAAAWRAAWIFSVAGWFGSANGIAMAGELQRVPFMFIVIAGICVWLATGFYKVLRWRNCFMVALVVLPALIAGRAKTAAPITPTTIERGRAVYVAEGCIHCHSQYVRPIALDEATWGSAGKLQQVLAGKPVLIGNRRQGPDLQHVGLRRSEAWLKIHFIEPRTLVPASVMPSYAHLFNDQRGDDLVTYLKSLGAERAFEIIGEREKWQPAPSAKKADAKHLFANHCAVCHGCDARGGGKLASRLIRPPTNLADGPYLWTAGEGKDAWQRVARTIKFGLPGTDMPGHEVFDDAMIRALTDELMSWREK
ncbi:MAG: cbb3-type cytochrome c oxidase subunit II [Verrucomicrobia bacterium]|nr:cbb3-type cytochrome c oxidase subunit II [Verrucomicrobiota bacterium]